MKQLLCLAALLALVVARPELYKETEDFQYSRHSSDEGSKAGYYGARRGNMGGNYEKAHNMDHLAQNQMSGLVRQVDGEVGEAAKLRTGNVFADASSAGIYGSGHYDTSNLRGRNFQEGVREGSFADSHSALASHSNSHLAGQAYQSSGYNSHAANSMYSGYQGTKSGQALHSANLQSSADAASAYERETGYSAGHHSQYEYQGAHNGYGVHPSNRLIVTTPVRVVVRPGGRVAVPVGVQNYDASHSASTMEHNGINTEAEVLNIPDHVIYKPSSSAKGYEASSSYQKHWEKHDVKPEIIPLAIPTENPFPINSELYDEHNALHSSALSSHGAIKSSAYNGYNANVKSASSQSRYQSAHDAQYAAGLNAHGYNTHGAYVGGIADTANVLDETRPKSHQSSYSYHKSWERQGDPYVIKPVGGVDSESQRLTAASANQGYASSHEYGAHSKSTQQRYYQANGVDCDCDENGQIRVARSVDEDMSDLTQQVQKSWGHERQRASDNLKEIGQQRQNQWDDTTQQAQSSWDHHRDRASDKLEDLGQQTQKQWGDLRQQSQTGWNTQHDRQQNLEKFDELGHQTRAEWDRQHARASEKFEDLGQQTQKQWGDLTQQSQTGWNTHHGRQQNLEKFDELGHQTRAEWERQHARASEKLEDLGQKTENQWDDLTQQAQTSWHGHGRAEPSRADQKLEDFGQHTQTVLEQQPQVTWDREDNTLTAKPDNFKYLVEKPKNPWNLEDLGQKQQKPWNSDIGQKQNSDNVEQQTQAHSGFVNFLRSIDQKKSDTRDRINSSETETHTNTHNINDEGSALEQQNGDRKSFYAYKDDDDLGQQTQKQSWDDFFHYSNVNKDVRPASQVKPVTPLSKWDQTEEDNTQQTVQNPVSGFFTRPANPWKPYQNRQSAEIDQQNEMQQSQHGWHTNGNTRTWQGYDHNNNNDSSQQTQDKSLQSLWDKINQFDKGSTNSSEYQKNQDNVLWQGQSTSQSTYHSTWQGEHESEYFDHNKQRGGSTGYVYDSWIPMIGDPGIINSVSTSTTKPKSSNQNENIRPVAIGRGDIGSDDVSKVTTTDKSYVSGYNHGFPIFTEDKRLKTPEEIEALSLTIHNENNNKPTLVNTSSSQDEYMEGKLKVLSLEQQKWLQQGQKLHESSSSRDGTTNITTDGKRVGIFDTSYQATNNQNSDDTQHSQSDRELFYNKPVYQNSQGFYTNRPVNHESTKPTSDSQHAFIPNWKDSNTNEISQNTENQDHLGRENLDQQSQSDWKEYGHLGQESLDFGKSTDNLEQQSETAWGHDLTDFGKQEKSAVMSDSHRQPDTLQVQKLGRSNTDQYQTQDFYNQRYYHANADESKKAEDLKVIPAATESKRIMDTQSEEVVPLAPMEPTEKPGFWKSVGNKLTNAKDKVASWFKPT